METGQILTLIGGIFSLAGGVLTLFGTALIAGLAGDLATGIVAAVGIWGVVVGAVMMLGAIMQNRTGAIIGLIFSILGLITLQGFVIGPILGIIGSAMDLGKK